MGFTLLYLVWRYPLLAFLLSELCFLLVSRYGISVGLGQNGTAFVGVIKDEKKKYRLHYQTYMSYTWRDLWFKLSQHLFTVVITIYWVA